MEFNINGYVEVVLTDFGADIYNNDKQYYMDKYSLEYTPKSEGDVLKDQLWHVMQLFGPHIHLGGDVPFKDCMMTIVEDCSR